jgi:hypothetical protein
MSLRTLSAAKHRILSAPHAAATQTFLPKYVVLSLYRSGPPRKNKLLLFKEINRTQQLPSILLGVRKNTWWPAKEFHKLVTVSSATNMWWPIKGNRTAA